jgi:hypothetical protein
MSSELELVNRSNTYANQQIASRFKSFVPKNWLFSVAIFWIASASAYDAYLVYIYREGIEEQNPICDWLIQLAPDSMLYFLVGKGLGTLLVIGALFALNHFWRRAGRVATLSLAAFQVALMLFIHSDVIGPKVIPRDTSLIASVQSENELPRAWSSRSGRVAPEFRRNRKRRSNQKRRLARGRSRSSR